MPAALAYLEHVAFRVRDLAPHLAFFREGLGMTVTQIQGAPEDPRQVWLLGGLQIIQDRDLAGTEGRFDHLGLVCTDVPAAIAAARMHGGVPTEKGPHWLRFPDGLLIEILPQKGDEVRIARDIDPRANASPNASK